MTKPKPNRAKPAPDAKASMNAAVVESAAKVLDYTYINQIHTLQAIVIARLSNDQLHWLRQREPGSISGHMQAGMPVIGLLKGKDLIGLALLAYPDNLASSNIKGYPVENPDQTMVIQSFIIHPDFQGAGQGKKLMDLIHAEAIAQGRPNLLARVATDNANSSDVFYAAGFRKVEDTPGNFSMKVDVTPPGTVNYKAFHWQKMVKPKGLGIKPAAGLHRTPKDSRPSVFGS